MVKDNSYNNWININLGAEIELLYGRGLSKKNRYKGKYAVYGSNGVIDYNKSYLVKGPGIIIGRKGSVGKIHFSKDNFWPIDTTYYLKLRKDGCLEFWYYFLQKCNFESMNSHAAVPGLNRESIYALDVLIPPLNEQKSIAKILSDLDSKIELLQEQNKTLEKIGQTIFKHWFVDFEFPNKEGKPYKSSNEEMIYNKELKKEIPKGWTVEKLKNLVIRNRNKIKEFNSWKDKDLLDLSNMPRFSMNICDFDKGEKFKSNIYELNEYDILFGSIRPYFGKYGFSPINGVIAGTIHSFKPVNKNFYSFILFMICSSSFVDFTIQYSKGTKMPIISWNNFTSYNFPVPEDSILINNFNNLLLPIIKKIKINLDVVIELRNLRDLLLPRLMNGKIKVLNK
jgi:type I restriction enzyme S subunit